MPIPFECSCGKKMSAKAEFAGRRSRCPECQRVVTIPKAGSALIPITLKQPGTPSSRILIQPNLPPSDVVAMDVTRPISQETEPPSKTASFDTAENLEALFAPSLSRTPIVAPLPQPQIAPVVAPPPNEPIVAQVVRKPEPQMQTEHPWIDNSLRQIATPWRPGDERLLQAGVLPAREADSPLGWIVPILVVVAACVFFAV